MEKVKFQKSLDESGKIIKLEVSGLFILENVELIKDKFIEVSNQLSKNVHLVVSEIEDIDLSGIQLFIAFFREMNKKKVVYTVEWDLDEDQKLLLENVGLSNELFIVN
jgi:anti-anti-sigma regulatory factor